MKKLGIALLCLATLLASVSCASTETPQSSSDPSSTAETQYMTFGASPATASMYPYWVAVGKTISTIYPEFNITISESQGAADIVNRIRSNEVILGNSISQSDWQNYVGEGLWEGSPNQDARILWYYDLAVMVGVVPESSDIYSYTDLAGEEVSTGGTGTTLSSIITSVLDLLEIQPDYYEASKSDAQEAFINRQVVYLCSATGQPDPFIVQTNASLDVRYLSFTEEEISTIHEAFPYITGVTVPAGTYENQTEDILTIQWLQGCQTSTELSQEDGYKMFKAVYENQEMWLDTMPTAANNDMIDITLDSPIPLHAGAVQYIEEQGIAVPESLIPPEYVK